MHAPTLFLSIPLLFVNHYPKSLARSRLVPLFFDHTKKELKMAEVVEALWRRKKKKRKEEEEEKEEEGLNDHR